MTIIQNNINTLKTTAQATTPRPRRGARPFTTQDLQAGETVHIGRIKRGRYTLVNTKAGVQVSGPALFTGVLTSQTLDTARAQVDRMMDEDQSSQGRANQEWKKSCAHHAALNKA